MADANTASNLTSRSKGPKKRTAADLIAIKGGKAGLSDSNVAGPKPQTFQSTGRLQPSGTVTAPKKGSMAGPPGFKAGGSTAASPSRRDGTPRMSIPKGEMPGRRIGGPAKPTVSPAGPKKGAMVPVKVKTGIKGLRPLPKPPEKGAIGSVLTGRRHRGRHHRPGVAAHPRPGGGLPKPAAMRPRPRYNT